MYKVFVLDAPSYLPFVKMIHVLHVWSWLTDYPSRQISSGCFRSCSVGLNNLFQLWYCGCDTHFYDKFCIHFQNSPRSSPYNNTQSYLTPQVLYIIRSKWSRWKLLYIEKKLVLGYVLYVNFLWTITGYTDRPLYTVEAPMEVYSNVVPSVTKLELVNVQDSAAGSQQ